MWKRYYLPSTVKEALDLLRTENGKARVVAGGTDLLLDIKKRRVTAEALVDITRIPLLKGIRTCGREVHIGAAVTHSEVARSSLIRHNSTALSLACKAVGSPMIRNVATVVGNVARAQPAADAAVALIALDASAEVLTNTGQKSLVPLQRLYLGVGRSSVDSHSSIITRVSFKLLCPNEGSAFCRLAQRKGLSLPVINVAVVVAMEGPMIKWARIVVGPVADRPARMHETESRLTGNEWAQSLLEEASQIAAKEANPRDSVFRGSKDYRRDMVRVLVRRGLEQAIRDAEESRITPAYDRGARA